MFAKVTPDWVVSDDGARLNSIVVGAPAQTCASRSAWRKVPGPLSAPEVTCIVVAADAEWTELNVSAARRIATAPPACAVRRNTFVDFIHLVST